MTKSKTVYALENAALSLSSAAHIAAEGALVFPSRSSGEWGTSITALNLRERAGWARDAADVMDDAADKIEKAWQKYMREHHG